MYANITQISFKTIYKCKIIFLCGNYPYREGVEIPSEVSKCNRTLNQEHARAKLVKAESN